MQKKRNKSIDFFVGLFILLFVSVTMPFFVCLVVALLLLLYHRAYEVLVFAVYCDVIFFSAQTSVFGLWTIIALGIFVLVEIFKKKLF